MSTLQDFQVKNIDGTPADLSAYQGKVVLVVNVASQCGFTPQYKGLEQLHEELAAKGLVVAGFPCNDFGGQEPGSEAEIKTFCETSFGVKFPLFGKLTVKGEAKHPLYQWLTTTAQPAGEVKWNFEKFLIDRKGQIVGRYSSKVAPESAELRTAIDQALAT